MFGWGSNLITTNCFHSSVLRGLQSDMEIKMEEKLPYQWDLGQWVTKSLKFKVKKLSPQTIFE